MSPLKNGILLSKQKRKSKQNKIAENENERRQKVVYLSWTDLSFPRSSSSLSFGEGSFP